MESLRIEKNTFKIEVNDKGEYIEFNLKDISLPDKIIKATDKMKKEQSILHQKTIAVEKQYKDNQSLLISKISEINKEYFTNMRSYFDEFLGENACLKIFGEDNMYGMFEDLMQKLEPSFDKMKIDIEQIKKDLVSKYSPKSKEIL